MKKDLKIKLADLSIAVMTFTIILILFWFIGYILSTTFELNVFAEKTTNFFLVFILAAFSIVICSAFLNISLNISLIADSRIQEIASEEKKKFSHKSYYTFSIIVASLVLFLFLGDILTRENEKDRLIEESKDLVTRYEKSVNEISEAIADTGKLELIPDILKFFSNQKEDFPYVQVITSTFFDGQLTFLTIEPYSSEKLLSQPFYNNSFYKCKTEDSKYLTDFFTKKNSELLFWSKKDEYYLYYPVRNKNNNFILLFSKRTRYGKFGS